MKRFALIMILVPLVLWILPNAFAASEEHQVSTPKEMVFRSYDLSCFRSSSEWMRGNMYASLPLIPFYYFSKGMLEPLEIEGIEGFSPGFDQIVEMLFRVVGEEQFEYDGARMEVREDRLMVRAPVAVQKKIATTLDFLRSHLLRRVALKCDLYEWTGTEPADSLDPTGVRQALEQGKLRRILSRAAEVRVGDLFEVREGYETPIITDWEPEIAESSVISEPVVHTIFTGIRLAIRPLPALDGKGLSIGFFGSISGFTQPVEFRPIYYSGSVTTESGWQEVAVSMYLSDPKISFATAATLVDLEPDSTALIVSAFPHNAGMGSLVISLTGRLLPAPEQVDLGEGQVLAAWDLGHFLTERLLPVGLMRQGFHPWSQMDEEWALRIAKTSLGWPGRLQNHFIDGMTEMLWEEDLFPEAFAEELEEGVPLHRMGDFIFLNSSPGLYRHLVSRMNETLLQKAASLDVRLRFVETDGPSVMTDAAGILQQGCLKGVMSLPLMNGRSATAVAGFEGLMVVNYDVDVATKCSIANPNVATYLDGAYAHFRHEPSFGTGNESSSLRIVVFLNRLNRFTDSGELGGRDSAVGIIDQPVFEKGFIDNRIKTDGKSVVLGSVSGERQGKMKTLYVIGDAKIH